MRQLRLLFGGQSTEFLSEAKKIFEENLYEVDTAHDGRTVQRFFSDEEKQYFAVILDNSLQNHSLPLVVKFIRTKKAGQKIIITYNPKKDQTSQEDKEEMRDFWQTLNLAGILEEPFKLDDLKHLLEGQKSIGEIFSGIKQREGQSPEAEVKEDDNKFIAIKIHEHYLKKAVLFDLFIRIGSNRFVKILHAGDTFSDERINKYKNEKGVEYLYISKTDLPKYLRYTNYLARKVIQNEKVSIQAKNSLLMSSAKKLLENAEQEGLNPQILVNSWETCESVYEMVKGDKGLWSLLRSLNLKDPSSQDHSYLCGLFSCSIIKQFEWESKSMTEMMVFACFFHDVGKLRFDPELIKKRPQEMSPAELKEYQQHPIYGVEVMEERDLLRPNTHGVKQIILQHHEAIDGTGFPYGIKGTRILTLSNILCLVDDFVHLMTDEELPPVESLRKILKTKNQVKRYNSNVLENFIKVFADPDKLPRSQ